MVASAACDVVLPLFDFSAARNAEILSAYLSLSHSFLFTGLFFFALELRGVFLGGYKSQDMTPSSEKAFNSGLVGRSAKNFVVTLPDLF